MARALIDSAIYKCSGERSNVCTPYEVLCTSISLKMRFYLNQYAWNGKYVVGLYVSNIEKAAI